MKTAFLSNKIQYICISLLLSAMHINTISDFIRSTCLIISWFIVIYYDLLWFIVIYHDISWFPAVLAEADDKCHCHANFCPIKHLIHRPVSGLQSTYRFINTIVTHCLPDRYQLHMFTLTPISQARASVYKEHPRILVIRTRFSFLDGPVED